MAHMLHSPQISALADVVVGSPCLLATQMISFGMPTRTNKGPHKLDTFRENAWDDWKENWGLLLLGDMRKKVHALF